MTMYKEIPREIDENRFWVSVLPTGFCWEWTGSLVGKGYGGYKYKGTRYAAHRISYTLLIGSIPLDKVLDHLCRNIRCVNPDHLEIVTQAENVRRGWLRLVQGGKTHCPQGHEYSEENIINRKSGLGRTCRLCALDRHRVNSGWSEEQIRMGIGPKGTICKRGHSLIDEANVYVDSRGSRVCKTCRRDRDRKRSRSSARL